MTTHSNAAPLISSKTKQNFTLQMRLKHREEQQDLEITLQSLKAPQKRYHTLISSHEAKEKHGELGIQSSQDLANYIDQHLEDLTIEPHGNIRLGGPSNNYIKCEQVKDETYDQQIYNGRVIPAGEGKNKECESKDRQWLQVQVGQLRKVVEAQSVQIDTLNRLVKEVQKELKVQKQQSVRLTYKIELLQEQKRKQSCMDEHKSQDRQNVCIKKRMGEETSLHEELILAKQTEGPRAEYVRKEGQIQFFKVLPHHLHLQNEMWQVEGDSRVTFKKMTDNSWHNFIMKAYLKTDTVYSITIKIARTQRQQIQLGVLSQEQFNKNNTFSNPKALSCVTCDLRTLSIWKQGKAVTESPSESPSEREGAGEGERVKMRVDRKSNRVEWFRRDQQSRYLWVGETSLPAHTLYKNCLFIAIGFYDYNDEVEVVSEMIKC